MKKHSFRRVVAETNIFDLAIGLAVAYVFVDLVNACVTNLLSPLWGVFFGKQTLRELHFEVKGFNFGYGIVLDALIKFLIIAFIVYWAARLLMRIKASWEKSRHNHKKRCCECDMKISENAKRCPYCCCSQ